MEEQTMTDWMDYSAEYHFPQDDEDYELYENCFHEWLCKHGCHIDLAEDKLVCWDMDLNKLKMAIAVLIMNTP